MNKKLTGLIVVGHLSGAHGVRGDVRVRSYTADPGALFTYGPLLSATGEPLLSPAHIRSAKDHYIVTPVENRQKEYWDRLKGTRLHVPRHVLPDTDPDEFYIEDLIGLDVFSGGSDKVGYVKAILNHGAGDLIEIQLVDSSEQVLVPFTHQDVPFLDLATKRLVVSDLSLWTETRDASGPSEP